MTDLKTLTMQDVNVLETALETAAANFSTTIRHLERIGEMKAAEGLRVTQNHIAAAREILMPAPFRAPTRSALASGAGAEALRRVFEPNGDRDEDAASAAPLVDLNPSASS